jgi:hypothetical protein
MRRADRIVLALILSGVIPTVVAAGDEDWRTQHQAELMRGLRAGKLDAEETLELARLTEDLGDLESALQVWDVISRHFPNEIVYNESSAPDWTYAELAAFWTKRIRHKIALPEHPMRPDSGRLRLMAEEVRASAHSGALNGRDGQIDLCVQTDLDGDAVDEVFMVGKYGPLGQRNEPFMCIGKWNGFEYRIAWRANTGGKRMRLFPSGFEIRDRDGDGLKEIGVGFEPNTDNAAMLYFNGEAAILVYY